MLGGVSVYKGEAAQLRKRGTTCPGLAKAAKATEKGGTVGNISGSRKELLALTAASPLGSGVTSRPLQQCPPDGSRGEAT